MLNTNKYFSKLNTMYGIQFNDFSFRKLFKKTLSSKSSKTIIHKTSSYSHMTKSCPASTK